MREFVNAFVIKTTPELLQKNICEGTPCTIIKRVVDKVWLAVFFNNQNLGDYAVTTINEECLRYDCAVPVDWIAQLSEKINDPKFYTKTSLNSMKYKEYDLVELVAEKEKYVRAGVHKGDIGCIMENSAIRGEWYVIFSEQGTGKDIAAIYVKEEDLKIVS